jgi:hypothetical protein
MLNNTRKDNLKGHGSAYDRGSADRYYGRGFAPHYYVGATSFTPRVEAKDMTPEEIAAYKSGWDNEDDRKEWN